MSDTMSDPSDLDERSACTSRSGRQRATTKRAITMLIAATIAVAFIAAVIVGSLGAGSESHMMPGGKTMTGGSMTRP